MKRGLILFLAILLVMPLVLAPDHEEETKPKIDANLLDNEVDLPFGIKFLLGVKDKDSFTVTEVATLIGVLLLIIVFLYSTLEYIPLIGGSRVRAGISAIIIGFLISMTGAVVWLADFLLDISTLFGLIENIGWLTFIIALLVIFILAFILRKILKGIYNRYRKGKARIEGHDVKKMSRTARVVAEQEEKLAE